MSDLRETIRRVLIDECDGRCFEDWTFDDEADAVLAAIAKDAVIVDKARWDVIANAAHDWAIECNEWAADRAADIRDALDGLYPKP